MGPLIMEMKRLRMCDPTDEFWPSGGKSDHNTPVRVWESLHYTGPRPYVQRFRRVADPRQGDLFT
jgi:hypothetical protein